jgi:hypothetical protein
LAVCAPPCDATGRVHGNANWQFPVTNSSTLAGPPRPPLGAVRHKKPAATAASRQSSRTARGEPCVPLTHSPERGVPGAFRAQIALGQARPCMGFAPGVWKGADERDAMNICALRCCSALLLSDSPPRPAPEPRSMTWPGLWFMIVNDQRRQTYVYLARTRLEIT